MRSSFFNKGKYIFFPIMFVAFVLGAGWVVMVLWNAILPSLIQGVGFLTFPKALGLLLLCKILFGGFKGRGNYGGNKHQMRNYWKDKTFNMTDEEKEKFKSEWRERCGK